MTRPNARKRLRVSNLTFVGEEEEAVTNEDPPNAHQAAAAAEEEVVVFTRENGGGIRSTHNTRNTDLFKTRTDESLALCRQEEEEEEEAVFIRDSITNEDPLNAHQTQHRPKPWVR